jgi:hypothetical protein
MEVSLDAPAGKTTVDYTDEDGKRQVETEEKDLPADIANGMVLTLVKNIAPSAGETVVSMLVATPKPRIVKLRITPAGRQSFSAGGLRHEATHYVVKVDLGGLEGLLVSLIGKRPPDSHVWVVGGEAPGFVRAEAPLYVGGPSWRIELASPDWQQG